MADIEASIDAKLEQLAQVPVGPSTGQRLELGSIEANEYNQILLEALTLRLQSVPARKVVESLTVPRFDHKWTREAESVGSALYDAPSTGRFEDMRLSLHVEAGNPQAALTGAIVFTEDDLIGTLVRRVEGDGR